MRRYPSGRPWGGLVVTLAIAMATYAAVAQQPGPSPVQPGLDYTLGGIFVNSTNATWLWATLKTPIDTPVYAGNITKTTFPYVQETMQGFWSGLCRGFTSRNCPPWAELPIQVNLTVCTIYNCGSNAWFTVNRLGNATYWAAWSPKWLFGDAMPVCGLTAEDTEIDTYPDVCVAQCLAAYRFELGLPLVNIRNGTCGSGAGVIPPTPTPELPPGGDDGSGPPELPPGGDGSGDVPPPDFFEPFPPSDTPGAEPFPPATEPVPGPGPTPSPEPEPSPMPGPEPAPAPGPTPSPDPDFPAGSDFFNNPGPVPAPDNSPGPAPTFPPLACQGGPTCNSQFCCGNKVCCAFGAACVAVAGGGGQIDYQCQASAPCACNTNAGESCCGSLCCQFTEVCCGTVVNMKLVPTCKVFGSTC